MIKSSEYLIADITNLFTETSEEFHNDSKSQSNYHKQSGKFQIRNLANKLMNPKLGKSITLRDSLAFPNSEITLDACIFIIFIGIEEFFKVKCRH